MTARMFLRLSPIVTSLAILSCMQFAVACNGDPDADGDGFVASEDCDDEDPRIRPSAPEQCNAIDDDCDGDTDEGVLLHYQRDADGDGYGTDEEVMACSDTPNTATNTFDCDDSDPDVHPKVPDICGNGVDEDCDGDNPARETWYADADGDGFGDPETTVEDCDAPTGFIADSSDCDDGDAAIHPDAVETCDDGIDSDCDGHDLAPETWYADADGDGFGDPATTVVDCEVPTGFIADSSDCDDGDAAVHPGVEERCDNAIDDDCDDVVASSADTDADGWYADACVRGFDCDDGDATTHPDAVETCDEIDSDCDGSDCCDYSADFMYSADFDAGVRSGFSGPSDAVGVQGWIGLGSGDLVFADQMLRSTSVPPEPIRLDLDGLPSHTAIRVAFLLAIIDSWDGLDAPAGGGADSFNVTVDGLSVFSHVFDATSGTSDYTPPWGGLLSSGSDLGFSSGTWMENDQAYDMSLEPAFDSIAHSASSVTIEFFASGPLWEGGDNESWAIDALCVSVSK